MASTYQIISNTTLTSNQATVTFSSISGAYTDLIIIFNGKNSLSGNTAKMRFNNDSGTNYSQTDLIGDGSTVYSQRRTNADAFRLYDVVASSNPIGNLIFNINNYSNTTTYKTTLLRGSDTGGEVGMGVNLWRNTSAINRIDFILDTGSWASGSTFTLYGIKAGS